MSTPEQAAPGAFAGWANLQKAVNSDLPALLSSAANVRAATLALLKRGG